MSNDGYKKVSETYTSHTNIALKEEVPRRLKAKKLPTLPISACEQPTRILLIGITDLLW